MKKHLIALLCLLPVASFVHGQEGLNLGFEAIENGQPLGWSSFGSDAYTTSIDTLDAYSEKYAVAIEYHGDAPDFKAWSNSTPANYDGKKIKLTGYLKTENVGDGWAGLWLRIDPGVGFDNMEGRGIKGTTGWTKYEVELDLKPEAAQKIVFGGLLVGKGKMWIDQLELTIDGLPLDEAKPKALLPAQKDTAFNNGSNISFPRLDEKLSNDLELLGKIWGFLKYHHPAVGRGDYNWDFELFRMLPRYLSNKGAAERDQILLEWIAKYGAVPPCDSCQQVAEDAFLKPDHSWLEESEITTPLKQKLFHILENRHQGNHFYIGMAPYVGNPQFNQELPYANMPYPDAGFRLLALYKYWNMIHYFFPYKHLIDKDWNEQLRVYLPLFLNAKDELAYEFAAIQIIGDIQDTHANLWRGANAIKDWKGKYYAPVHVRFIENQLVVTDYYNPELKAKTGLKIGDIITKINGKKVEEIVTSIKKYYPASNEPTRLRDISADLLRSNQQEIAISYIREKKELNKKLELYERDSLNIYRWYRRNDKKSYKMLDGNIGYVTLKNIKEEDIPIIKDTFQNTKGIIIDIRNYPSTFVPFSLGGYFVSDTTAFVKFTGGNVNNPGEFTFTEPISIPNQASYYKGKLIVIVNELSQSQAEYTAMAFQAGDNTTIIGSTTAGADGNVSAIHLPGGLRTMISGIGVYYPDGTETQRIGIVPDIEVLPTIEGIRKGEDELLMKAIELINNQ